MSNNKNLKPGDTAAWNWGGSSIEGKLFHTPATNFLRDQCLMGFACMRDFPFVRRTAQPWILRQWDYPFLLYTCQRCIFASPYLLLICHR